jgi:hypothetical protein
MRATGFQRVELERTGRSPFGQSAHYDLKSARAQQLEPPRASDLERVNDLIPVAP